MNKMLRMAMTAVAMVLVVSTVSEAQGGGGGRGGRGGNPMAVLKDSLKVSDAILAKADSLFKAYQAETQPLGEAARGGDADAMGKIQAARTKMNDAIKALLTDAQKTEYDRLLPQRGRRGGGGGL